MENVSVIQDFYNAFKLKDFKTMQECYHNDATFSDPVFLTLSAREVRAMWEMLLKSSSDLKIDYKNIKGSGERVSCDWEALYTFSLTGKKVFNVIHADFVMKDGKIFSHNDHFDLWRWTRMAFGLSGILLGWSPFMQKKIRAKARARLDSFIKKAASA
jgi:ketosteroid isomerase-like protein